MPTAGRQIWLCADDYGISRSVNAAIRELILRERINATSVMTAAAHLDADEVAALDELNSGKTRAALGLHVTLTGPFKPLSEGFKPLSHAVSSASSVPRAAEGPADNQDRTAACSTAHRRAAPTDAAAGGRESASRKDR